MGSVALGMPSPSKLKGTPPAFVPSSDQPAQRIYIAWQFAVVCAPLVINQYGGFWGKAFLKLCFASADRVLNHAHSVYGDKLIRISFGVFSSVGKAGFTEAKFQVVFKDASAAGDLLGYPYFAFNLPLTGKEFFGHAQAVPDLSEFQADAEAAAKLLSAQENPYFSMFLNPGGFPFPDMVSSIFGAMGVPAVLLSPPCKPSTKARDSWDFGWAWM